jgi:hypothetical protein
MEYILIFLLILAIIFLSIKLWKKSKEYNSIYLKYKDVIDIEEYKNKIKQENELIEKQITELRSDYSTKRIHFEALINEIALYEEKQEILSYGMYTPHFDFDTSDKYKIALLDVREKEKELIKNDKAVLSSMTMTVEGSETDGKRQIKNYKKLMLRAFNGECEGFIADVRWNNILKMEERILKAFEVINKVGELFMISITENYFNLKQEELRLTFEYQDKLHKEKEEQKRIQEQIREEDRAQKEIEKALKDSEDEEKRKNNALEQARKEMEKATGEQLTKLKEKMIQLQTELEEARELKQRALSMAMQTKVGKVYVISNIGSFGENVFKIGMTRRLDPMDRVRELGNASVPFEFDVHAMIHSENAPELEKLLHKEFDSHKVNLVNDRREFFNVSLDDIERTVKKYDPKTEFTKIAEAREFRESMVMREKRNVVKKSESNSLFDKVPVSI